MKKIAALILSLFLVGTVYAKEAYSGDFKLTGGLGFGGLVLREGDFGQEYTSTGFDIGLSTTHLFDLNSTMSLGFSCQLDFSFGGADEYQRILSTGQWMSQHIGSGFTMEMLLGPTFAVKCGEVVKFSGTLGFAYNVVSVMYEDRTSSMTFIAPGVGFDINAKFVPNKNVSPVVGYTMCFGFPSGAYDKDGSYYAFIDSSASFTNITGTLYAGVSWNW